MTTKPKVLQGGISVDDRGSIYHVNDFDFADVKRFYQVRNHRVGYIRAWHGHISEAKYVFVPQGSVLVKVVSFEEMKRWKIENQKFLNCTVDNTDIDIFSYVLSSEKSTVLFIPPGHYNGFKTLTDDAIIQFFSTSTLEESKKDDHREAWDIFGEDVWKENYR